jgi:hypothetical protein
MRRTCAQATEYGDAVIAGLEQDGFSELLEKVEPRFLAIQEI